MLWPQTAHRLAFLRLSQTLPPSSRGCTFKFWVSYSLAGGLANGLNCATISNEKWLGLCCAADSLYVPGACCPLYWPPVPKGLPQHQQFKLSHPFCSLGGRRTHSHPAATHHGVVGAQLTGRKCRCGCGCPCP